ncbi:unnamed protein product [Camellia sinensis]
MEDIQRKLHSNVMAGKWLEVVEIYQNDSRSEVRHMKLTYSRDTALHMAVYEGKTDIVKQLVSLIAEDINKGPKVSTEIANLVGTCRCCYDAFSSLSPHVINIKEKEDKAQEDLANDEGNNPLHVAARLGNMEICLHIAHKVPCLIGCRNKATETPFFLAALHGKTEAFLILHVVYAQKFKLSADEFYRQGRRNSDGRTILHCAIDGEYFDLAYEIIRRFPDFLSTIDDQGYTPFHVLATKRSAFGSSCSLTWGQRFIYRCTPAEKPKVRLIGRYWKLLHEADASQHSKAIATATATPTEETPIEIKTEASDTGIGCSSKSVNVEDQMSTYHASQHSKATAIAIATPKEETPIEIKTEASDTGIGSSSKSVNVKDQMSTYHATSDTSNQEMHSTAPFLRSKASSSSLLPENRQFNLEVSSLNIPVDQMKTIQNINTLISEHCLLNHLNHTVIGGREIRIVFAEENRKTPQEMRRVTRPRLEEEATGGEVQQGPQDAAIAILRTAGPGMIITLHADLDLFQDQFHHPLMREIIGQTRSPQGIPDPFQGLFLHARRGITGQTTGPQAREGMVVVPVMRGMMNPAGHRALGEMGGVPQGLIHDPTGGALFLRTEYIKGDIDATGKLPCGYFLEDFKRVACSFQMILTLGHLMMKCLFPEHMVNMRKTHMWAKTITDVILKDIAQYRVYFFSGAKPESGSESMSWSQMQPDETLPNDLQKDASESPICSIGTLSFPLNELGNDVARLLTTVNQSLVSSKSCPPNDIKKETPILIAAKNGIEEIIQSILKTFHVAVHDVNSDGKNMMIVAVENRQPQIYQLLVKTIKKEIIRELFLGVDKEGNSALHLAAMLKTYQPWRAPDAILQMQWEIKWYKCIEVQMPPHLLGHQNKDGKTAEEVFMETHNELVKNDIEWLMKTSDSCTIVAALIATVAFATSVSVPGGTKSHGEPVLGQEPMFEIFSFSSLGTLCFSLTAVVMFLSILTSRHQPTDFGSILPTKLLICLTALFLSIASVLVSFCGGHFFPCWFL